LSGGVTLLKTKLQRPAMSQPVLPRPHLTARLQGEQAVTVISAPPGAGKTTLLADWASGSGAAWLTLDELDNDLNRFLAHLIGAVQGTSDAPHDISVTTALNAMTRSPLALVLDDFHLISNAAIHDSVSFIIDHLPPRARLILAGRTYPPLPLARWRVAGWLAQIDDLSFTTRETAAFLGLAHDDAALLQERSGGWIAGLQLAALWLRGGGEARAFGASYRHVYDYFMQEVFAMQSSAAQRFLLQTSIADPLCADLCNALTGRADGQIMLERLEQMNLFVTPLDDLRHAYRYHPLFAEFLREYLSRQGGAADLHLRASIWHEHDGTLVAAVDHALEAKAWERAASLIERCAAGGTDVSRWLARLPDDLRPRTLVAPLSDRETEILHLILSGMSNPEIARRLIIAVSTVKTHVKSIYRKLEVDTRYEAMQRARELNLMQIRLEGEYRRLIK
jgi:LuxR family maltose regulon positive regulatory protein